MIKLTRVSSNNFIGEGIASIYEDGDLIDVNFNLSLDEGLKNRPLIKYRYFRGDGAAVSFDMRGGVMVGFELIGIDDFSKKDCMSIFDKKNNGHVPVFGIELDGPKSVVDFGVMNIDQECDFDVSFFDSRKSFEISIGDFFEAFSFANVIIFFDRKSRLSGVRVCGLVGA